MHFEASVFDDAGKYRVRAMFFIGDECETLDRDFDDFAKAQAAVKSFVLRGNLRLIAASVFFRDKLKGKA